MRITYLHKLFSLLLVIAMISHLSYFHNILDNYVVCYGSDGHIAIENINNNSECSNLDLILSSSFSGEIIRANIDCIDVSLDDYCSKDAKNISVNKTTINFELQKKAFQILSFDTQKHNPTINNSHSIKIVNNILEKYTTVLLLI